MTRKLFVTTALPYANGNFHIGHIMEYIQADIWVRFQRMQGHQVHFVGADDAHGAPIMIAAEKAGKTPQEFVAAIAAGRKQYLDGFHISFDNWHSTDSPENTQLAQDIYRALRRNGLIYSRHIEQFFDPVKEMFLPDRYIKGECPRCGAKDQYGDSCEVCGAVYAPTELKNPYSTLTGATPVMKSSEHYFFQLSSPRCIEFLQQWTQDGKLQPEVANKVKEWFATDDSGAGGLSDWDISRDAPYFGIEIPDAPGKYFYVWLDAPVGYLASLKNYFDKGGPKAKYGEVRSFEDFIADPEVEQYHFIGKDITYFHTLFWPAMLHFSGRKTPNNVFVHGFITVSGEKMSKSRGTGIDPLKYLSLGMNAEWLRYYIAAKLNARVEDVDFNPDDFVARVNSDLVGKYVNIASRAAGFIAKRFGGRLTAAISADGEQLLATLRAGAAEVGRLYEEREYGKAVREIMLLADRVNEYVDQNKPWELAKQEGQDARLHEVCSVCIEAFRLLTIYLKPVLPALAANVEAFLKVEPLSFADAQRRLGEHVIGTYQHLMQRVDPKLLDALFEPPAPAAPALPGGEAIAPTIGIEDFAKVDLRIAKIVNCEHVEGSDKLLRLTLDVGEGRTRNVFSGIKSAYKPEDLIGKLTVMVANLAPRKMKFGVSEGMVLAASHADEKAHPGVFVLEPWPGAEPGMRVR
ncbi:methionine--tRNA ligase [Caldimonas thermodepolymerans]|jgi:methionyl-tRNA synthetase/methionyl-tRNA synthetase C-terminal region/beta chain|uniref:Methionine--tRNA ligase n=1 Tax=Caldimonas thermodepolymerans TaxID=215580 RepID=A0A2S5T0V1_9BURK|nr:methionine--tRNA ligase [Caldimonas thermodepolymerans]PPE68634.1 methionine--tRNA ligase [Caldimonas thermodepolymerans]QPC30834.1 methionine--tRNA ligase [Caldimonas thermodepolymerans]RDH94970.1 methionyl-tRNA synthetase [Caldimonas thermodepolymerans]TCP08933.1 methionyl-tRNA synthetase [Caldimonas thermodepolymerans]UZG47243.1 methionine--tRNA ligase [Caldimonas thermodepolymerans]